MRSTGAVLAACAVALTAAAAGCSGSRSCADVVGGLTAGSKVADYQGPLAESCQDYQQFVDAYDDLPCGQGPGLAPGFTLIFCAPVSEPNTPTSVYNSELCSSARSSDPDLPGLR